MRHLKVVLVGNPNVGKTSLLNHLAGTQLKIGNWPGVTVEKKEGKAYYKDYEINFIDLPGIYTLEEALTEDEVIAVNYLKEGDYDLILNVIEAPRFKRDFYLTLQLIELNKPMVIALNMSDEAKALGLEIDDRHLSELLNLKVIKTNGRTGEGVRELLPLIVETYEKNLTPKLQYFSFAENEAERALALVQGIYAEVLRKPLLNKKTLTDTLDQFFLHPYLGFFIFALVLFVTFKLVFSISTPMAEILDTLFQDTLVPLSKELFEKIHTPKLITQLISEAILGGVGTVLTFLPLVFIMFFFITLLEASGYLPRVAFLLDPLTHRVGLHGQSLIPLILGFGCNVPALLATRTLQNKFDRLLVMAMIPFMSCQARLVVFSFFALTFFTYPTLLILSLYILGIFFAFLTGLVLRKTLFKSELTHFLMDLPPYRFPSLNILFRITWSHTKNFLVRAGTIIFAISVFIWFLLHLPPGERELENTLAGKIGKVLTPLFEPIGLGDWRITTSLIPAFLAREAILSNMAVILKVEGIEGEEELAKTPFREEIKKVLPKESVFSFLIFVLIYNSCVATFVTMWKEGSRNLALSFLLYSFFLAWILAWIIYHLQKIF
ncbi:MAG: ferrous iron transport protein B [Caldimicrobium sp.]